MLCIEASASVIHLYLFIEFFLHYATNLYIELILNETLSSHPSKWPVPVLFSFPQCYTVLETLRACLEFKMKSCRFDIVQWGCSKHWSSHLPSYFGSVCVCISACSYRILHGSHWHCACSTEHWDTKVLYYTPGERENKPKPDQYWDY